MARADGMATTPIAAARPVPAPCPEVTRFGVARVLAETPHGTRPVSRVVREVVDAMPCGAPAAPDDVLVALGLMIVRGEVSVGHAGTLSLEPLRDGAGRRAA